MCFVGSLNKLFKTYSTKTPEKQDIFKINKKEYVCVHTKKRGDEIICYFLNKDYLEMIRKSSNNVNYDSSITLYNYNSSLTLYIQTVLDNLKIVRINKNEGRYIEGSYRGKYTYYTTMRVIFSSELTK